MDQNDMQNYNFNPTGAGQNVAFGLVDYSQEKTDTEDPMPFCNALSSESEKAAFNAWLERHKGDTGAHPKVTTE